MITQAIIFHIHPHPLSQEQDHQPASLINFIGSIQLCKHGLSFGIGAYLQYGGFNRFRQDIYIIFKIMSELLSQIRAELTKRGWGVYVLPRTDEHQSEYIGQSDERVKFVSGFSGSNAIAIISQKEALLWTDGRYFLQAQTQLAEGWQLRKMMEGVNPWHQHILAEYPKDTIIGIDPRLLSADSGIIRTQFLQKSGYTVDLSIQNIIDPFWTTRPNPPKPNIFIHEQWAGKSISEKVNWVRQKIIAKDGNAAIFNDLSKIAWVLNLRSSEIPHNPFFKGVLIIKKEGGTLYLPQAHPSLNSEQIKAHLQKEGISLQQYEPVFVQKTLIKKSDINFYIYNAIKDLNPIEWEGIDLHRSVRNQKQINGFRRCHIVDGIAMTKFWAWRSKFDEIDEYEAALYMNNRRYEQEHNKGLSFDTISGGGPNAAVIHYHPTETNHSLVTKNMIHLVDSGGQYLDGTTDCTRTYHFGNPTAEEKDSFTRVLLGNLDIQRLKWPRGKLTGGDVDVFARRHLWSKGLDYMHGTGHGVGHFLGVHQGPVGISSFNKVVFTQGQIVTNEPGYYEPGKYGIRIQNMLLVRQTEGHNWFQNLTVCPYDKNLMDLSLLSNGDIKFINDYHNSIWQKLSPRLVGDEPTLQWLKKATSPL